jgi:nitroimidazol reductase NimA-like FMN-containing flavoprotein (pyridoxamine 5'-phosphate oxidase superfamily)
VRRSEKEIHEKSGIEAVIEKATVCRLGLSVDHQPYVVPLNFGYEKNTLYFHGAVDGRKIDMIRKNPRICFEMDVNSEIVKESLPCFWGMRYESVIGFGKAEILADFDEKQRGLGIIMAHYAEEAFTFDPDFVHAVAVIRVDIESMTGKKSG